MEQHGLKLVSIIAQSSMESNHWLVPVNEDITLSLARRGPSPTIGVGVEVKRL